MSINSQKKILFIAPLDGVMHGQRNISIRIKKHLKSFVGAEIDTNFENRNPLFKIFAFIKGIFLITSESKNYDFVYFSTKRSKVGILSDCFYIILLNYLNKKITIHVHGSEFLDNFKAFPSALRNFVTHSYNKISNIILLYPELEAQYQFEARNVIIENYVPNFDAYSNVDIESKQDKIFYLSILLKEKGILNLIKAFEEFADHNSRFTLEIAGSELTKSPNIKSIIDTSRHSNRINFHGFISESKKISLFKESKIFCLPSFYKTEAQPTSIMEAICAQCICIGGSVGSIPDLLKKNNFNIKVNGESHHEIYQALIKASKLHVKDIKKSYNFLSETDWCKKIEAIILSC